MYSKHLEQCLTHSRLSMLGFNSVVIFLLLVAVVSDLHVSFHYKEIPTASTQLCSMKADYTHNGQHSTGHIIPSQ